MDRQWLTHRDILAVCLFLMRDVPSRRAKKAPELQMRDKLEGSKLGVTRQSFKVTFFAHYVINLLASIYQKLWRYLFVRWSYWCWSGVQPCQGGQWQWPTMTNLFQNASCFQCIFGISRFYSQFMRFVRICHCFRVSFPASLHKWLEVRSRRCSNIANTQQSYLTRHFRQSMSCYDQDGCPNSTGKVMKKSTIPSSWPCQCCCFLFIGPFKIIY